jgi:tetratricopeptide (TPR) repeat protein
MISDKFRTYLFVDNSQRRRDDRISLCIAFGVYLWLLIVPASTEKTAAIGALIVLGLSMCFHTVYYCLSAGRSKTFVMKGLLYRPVPSRAALTSLFLLATFGVTPLVEAAVIDRRLRNLAHSAQLSPDEAEQIARNLEFAAKWKIPLGNDTLLQVRDTIKESAVQSSELAPLAKSVSALVDYDHPRVATAMGSAPPSAIQELQRALPLAIRGSLARNRDDLQSAIKGMTQAIELSKGYPIFQARALLNRALVESSLGNMNPEFSGYIDAALADVQAAEALGSLSLGEIVRTEGLILSSKSDPRELQRAVNLLTLSIDLDSQESGPIPLVDIYAARCSAYFKLRDYRRAAADARRVVGAGRNIPTTTQGIYMMMILSYLALRDYPAALGAASEYRARIGDPISERWLEVVQRYSQDPQQAWNLLYEEFVRFGGVM